MNKVSSTITHLFSSEDEDFDSENEGQTTDDDVLEEIIEEKGQDNKAFQQYSSGEYLDALKKEEDDDDHCLVHNHC